MARPARELRTRSSERIATACGCVARSSVSCTAIRTGRWLQITRLREVTFFSLTPAELLRHITTQLSTAATESAKEAFLYEAALIMTFSLDWPASGKAFDALYAMADDRENLRRVRDAAL